MLTRILSHLENFISNLTTYSLLIYKPQTLQIKHRLTQRMDGWT